jgi:hypothetical protein
MRMTATRKPRGSTDSEQPLLDADDTLDIAEDFITGACRRHTKTKPLRHVDIMIVLRSTEYLDRHPHDILEVVRAIRRYVDRGALHARHRLHSP